MPHLMREKCPAQRHSRPRYIDEPDSREAVEAPVACDNQRVVESVNRRIHIAGSHLLGLGNRWAEFLLVNTVECHWLCFVIWAGVEGSYYDRHENSM
jgi:hypothetical protein